MPLVDRGHEATQERRACMVGWGNVNAPEAGYPLGVLKLKSALPDSGLNPEQAAIQNEERHRAGLEYAADHAIVFGIGSPKSHLAAIIDGIRQRSADTDLDPSKFARRANERYTDKVEALFLRAGLVAFNALERIVVDEVFELTPAELPALRRALRVLVELRQ